jgi:PTS system cellobiose-specific IIB component
MTNVLVICGAGASSSFLVHQLRKRAQARGLAATFTAGTLHDLPAQISASDVVFVGAHLAASFAEAEAVASAAHARAVLLPVVTFDAAGADLALDLLSSTPKESASHA